MRKAASRAAKTGSAINSKTRCTHSFVSHIIAIMMNGQAMTMKTKNTAIPIVSIIEKTIVRSVSRISLKGSNKILRSFAEI